LTTNAFFEQKKKNKNKNNHNNKRQNFDLFYLGNEIFSDIYQSFNKGPNFAEISLKDGLWEGDSFQQCCISSTNNTEAGLSCGTLGIGGWKIIRISLMKLKKSLRKRKNKEKKKGRKKKEKKEKKRLLSSHL